MTVAYDIGGVEDDPALQELVDFDLPPTLRELFSNSSVKDVAHLTGGEKQTRPLGGADIFA